MQLLHRRETAAAAAELRAASHVRRRLGDAPGGEVAGEGAELVTTDAAAALIGRRGVPPQALAYD